MKNKIIERAKELVKERSTKLIDALESIDKDDFISMFNIGVAAGDLRTALNYLNEHILEPNDLS